MQVYGRQTTGWWNITAETRTESENSDEIRGATAKNQNHSLQNDTTQLGLTEPHLVSWDR